MGHSSGCSPVSTPFMKQHKHILIQKALGRVLGTQFTTLAQKLVLHLYDIISMVNWSLHMDIVQHIVLCHSLHKATVRYVDTTGVSRV